MAGASSGLLADENGLLERGRHERRDEILARARRYAEATLRSTPRCDEQMETSRDGRDGSGWYERCSSEDWRGRLWTFRKPGLTEKECGEVKRPAGV